MPPLPRGTCPVCRADVALRRGSLVREHKDQRHDLYATGRNDEVPTCAGSGREIETVEPHVDNEGHEIVR